MTQVTTGKSQPAAVPHVIVIGAGFAGLNAVKALGQGKFRVSLIDRNLYSTFQPLLYQVATGGLNPGDVSYAIGGYTRKHGARYCRGTVTSIDTAARRITLDDGRSMAYDYLILATGVSASHFGIKGADKYTYGLYTRRDAVTLRDRFFADVEGLSEGPADSELAITMVGGGAPASSWPARSPNCATPCCARRSRTSTPPAFTSGWSRCSPSCWARSTRNCATTPGTRSSSAGWMCSWIRPSPRLAPTG